MNKHRQASVVDQKMALRSYLEDLLSEVPQQDESPASETRPVREQAPVIPMPLPTVAPPEPELEPEPEPAPVQAVDEAVAEPQEVEQHATGATHDEGIPVWGREAFQCLMFSVGSLSLAVPLVKLNGVIPWSDEVTEMPGHSPAFLGLLRHLEQNVKIVDTAKLVLPDAQATDLGPAADRLNNIILIDEGRWGLACDAIGEVLTLRPEDVKWRSSKGKRPWLAGTVMEHLCAVMDVDDFSQLLLQGQK
jgi:purine-binding chemotaxis protein CheW